MDTGDTAWILTASALVLLMTPGLAFFYGGLAGRKNALSTIMYSFMTIGIVGVVWVLWGYTLAFGNDVGGFVGDLKKFGLNDVSAFAAPGENISEQTFMIFQGMFAIITPALVTGAFAGRMKFSALVIFITLWVTIVYAPLAHWVWGGGWLSDINDGAGALDFAGGTVVHINAGVGALAAAIIIGPRLGFGTRAMTPHNVPMVVLGAALLWFGWFGFNAGSALAADAFAVNAFVVTNTATAMAMMAWVGMSWIFGKKPSVVGAASGAVAGLVAITPASGYVGAMPAIIIGLGAGVFCYAAVELLLKFKVDDALAVWGVHGIGGTWGALATGLFVGIGFMSFGELSSADNRGEQILYQLVGIGATWGWAFVTTAVIMLAIKYTIGLRPDSPQEEVGLDLSEHGEEAYVGEADSAVAVAGGSGDEPSAAATEESSS